MATIENFTLRVRTEGTENLDKLKASTEGAKAKIESLTSALLGLSFGALVKGALEAADGISDLSDATGISIVNLKSFEDALQASGGKAKNVERAILGFAQAIETANDGSLKAREAFYKVGVSLQDLKTLSEQDLLQKTIEGLARMKDEGKSASEVGSTGAILLTKAFRGIDVQNFFKEYESGKITLQGVADKIKDAADMNGRLETSFKNLQLASIEAMNPLLKLFGDHTTSVETYKTAIQGLGIAFGLAVGANAVANLMSIIKLMGEWNILSKVQAGLQMVITALSGPKGIATLAASVAAASAAYAGFNIALKDYTEGQAAAKKKDDEAAASIKAATDARRAFALTDPRRMGNINPERTENRLQELDPKQKALLESEKRIAQSGAEARRQIAIRSGNELATIYANSDADMAKAAEEINSQQNLTKEQKSKELAAKIKEMNAKLATDIAKFNNSVDEQYRNERIARAVKEYQEEEAYRLTQVQVTMDLRKQSEERSRQTDSLRGQFNLQEQIFGLSAIEQKRLTDLFNLEELRKQTLYEISNIKDLPKDERIAAEKKLNDEIEKRKKLIDDEAAARKAHDADFVAGVKNSMTRYQESMTPLKQGEDMANSVFSNMGNAVDNFVDKGGKSFADFRDAVILDLIRIALKAQMTQLFVNMAGLGGDLISKGMSFLTGKAGGGPVSAGTPYIVGEKGPELFMPAGSGTIIPNNKLGGGGSVAGSTNVTYNIQAVDAMSFKQMLARDPSFLYAVTQQGAKSVPATGR